MFLKIFSHKIKRGTLQMQEDIISFVHRLQGGGVAQEIKLSAIPQGSHCLGSLVSGCWKGGLKAWQWGWRMAVLYRQQEEGKGTGQEGIDNLNKRVPRRAVAVWDTLSQCCSRKGSWLLHYTVAGSLCYSSGAFGKSHKIPSVCQLLN